MNEEVGKKTYLKQTFPFAYPMKPGGGGACFGEHPVAQVIPPVGGGLVKRSLVQVGIGALPRKSGVNSKMPQTSPKFGSKASFMGSEMGNDGHQANEQTFWSCVAGLRFGRRN